MKHIFETTSLNEVLQRIDTLKPEAQRQWGTMNVSQMLSHCSSIIEIGLGERQGRSNFIGKIIGPLFKKQATNEKPFKHGLPTDPASITTDKKDFQQEKTRLIDTVKRLVAKKDTNEQPPRHPFFGNMSYAEWSRATYKHLDHHLQQFSA